MRRQIRSFPAPSVHAFVWLGSLRMRSFSLSSLCMWVTIYFMIYVPVYVSVLGRGVYVEKKKREALCSPFLFGWLRGAMSFIFIKDNDRKLLFSSLSDTLVFFLVFQLAVFFFAQNVSLQYLHISIFSCLSFFVMVC